MVSDIVNNSENKYLHIACICVMAVNYLSITFKMVTKEKELEVLEQANPEITQPQFGLGSFFSVWAPKKVFA